MAFIVRGVDWGNIQRSPTFQAVFNYTVSGMNLPLDLKFDSAGIMVDKVMKNLTPVSKKLEILDTGKSYGFFAGDEQVKGLLEKWLGKKEIPVDAQETITLAYAQHKDGIHTKEMEFRNIALREVGIPDEFIPGMRIPFRHDKDLMLIVPVDRVTIPKIEEYYTFLGVRMPMSVLYGNLVSEEELPDKLKGGIELAREQVNYFMRTRYKAIDKILELLDSER